MSEDMKRLNDQLGKYLDEERRKKAQEQDRMELAGLLGEQLQQVTIPIIESIAVTNENTQKALESFASSLKQQQLVMDKGMKEIAEATGKIKVNVPELKIPKIESPIIPPISVPKSNVVVDTANIEKTLQKGLQSLKPPIVNVPEANIEVKVPKMDFKWPKGNQKIEGWVQLMGVDLQNPLPVQLRTPDGKPYVMGGGSSGSSGPRKVGIIDSDGIQASVDKYTESLQTVTYEHHEIHSGSHYFVSNVVDLAINEVFDIQFTTPDSAKNTHFVFRIDVENQTEWYIYEGATIATAGTSITPINNNRNSINTSGNTVAHITNASVVAANADTAVAGATTLAHGMAGIGRSGGEDSRDREIILKSNTTYCFRAIATSAGFVDYIMQWYEHENKN